MFSEKEPTKHHLSSETDLHVNEVREGCLTCHIHCSMSVLVLILMQCKIVNSSHFGCHQIDVFYPKFCLLYSSKDSKMVII